MPVGQRSDADPWSVWGVTHRATFVRVELPVMNLERAGRFYRDVFGWQFELSMESLAVGKSVHTAPDPLRPASPTLLFAGRGVPGVAGWLAVTPEVGLVKVDERAPTSRTGATIGVDSIEDAFVRIEEAGGRRVAEAEVIDDIRTALFADSEGNEVGLWSPGQEADFSWRPHAGATVVDGVTFQYVELPALSLHRAARFYSEVFGWTFTPPHSSHAPRGPFPSARRPLYGEGVVLYCNDLRPEVGLRKVEVAEMCGGIGVVVGVDSLPAALRRISEAGGSIHRDVEAGAEVSLATVRDPEGNLVSLVAPAAGRRFAWTPHVMTSRT